MRNADAARLLAAATSRDGLHALVRAIGFPGTPVRLPAAARGALGGDDATDLHVGRGPGDLRALVGVVVGGQPTRDVLLRLARRTTVAAPSPLWIVAVASPGASEVAVAAWTAVRGAPRIAALVVDPRRVVESDAETVCALAAATATARDHRDAGGDVLAHARWMDVLGRDGLSRRFYRQLERAVGALASGASDRADDAVRQELALLAASRLLFLTFLESKGWLDGDRAFLRRRYDACLATGGGFHDRVLRPLFFGTLNTPVARRAALARAFGRVPFLNGGLFAPTRLEGRHRTLTFDDGALGAIVVDLLGRFRFTARETATTISEAAVDPEMLGRAFESLMAAATRRATGAFYTPQPLVALAIDEALRAALASGDDGARLDADVVERLLTGAALSASEAQRARARLGDLRLLDPACGSGAFLVQALERVAALRAQCGDRRPTADVRRDVLATSIFGVDVNATAVWLCELRLWLSVVIETTVDDPTQVAPLPNLDRNVRIGDALAAPAQAQGWGGDPWASAAASLWGGERLARLRRRYVAASGARKASVARTVERTEREQAVAALDRAIAVRRAERADLLAAARGRDLFGARRGSTAAERARLDELRRGARGLGARRRSIQAGGALPFGFAWHFAELAARGGCDAIVGNPPWVRPHAIEPRERLALRAAYESCRRAGWSAGAELARAGHGFAGQADLAAPFVERSLALVREGGAVSLLLPAKLWRALAGGGLRRVLARESHVRVVEDWSDAPAQFDAATYPSLLVATRGRPLADAPTTIRLHDRSGTRHARLRSLPLDADAASPWLLVPADVRAAIERLRAAGPPLGHASIARLLLGVKCGCNDAYVVRLTGERGPLAEVEGVSPSGEVRRGLVERALLRPVVRGEDLHGPREEPAGRGWIVWPHDAGGEPLAALPPHAAAWLAPWRARLAARSDARGAAHWWAAFRTAAARCDRPRVIWADVARALRPQVLAAGDPRVPLNSCYALACTDDADATALAALLASDVAGGWFAALAEPARGGYRRHLAWTVALLPLPRDWVRARRILVDRASAPDVATTAAAYDVPADALAPLVAWNAARHAAARDDAAARCER